MSHRREHDVFRLEIPMDDPERVGVAQGGGHLGCELDHRRRVERPRFAQRAALDVRHGVVQVAGGDAGIEERKDVRVLEAGLGPDLALESLDSQRCTQGRVEHLECDPTAMPQVPGQVDGGAGPSAKLVLDQVAVGQLPGQLIQRVPHGTPRLCGDINLRQKAPPGGTGS